MGSIAVAMVLQNLFIWLAWLAVLANGAPTYEGCHFDVHPSGPILHYSGGSPASLTPDNCYIECQKQRLIISGRSLAVGISDSTCFCGYDFDPLLMVAAPSVDCQPCPAEATSFCGAPDGVTSVYSYPGLTVSGLYSELKNWKDEDATQVTLQTGEILYSIVSIGDYRCDNYPRCASPPAAGATSCTPDAAWTSNPACDDGTSGMPPVEIVVDYGDGSGARTWQQGLHFDYWKHVYVTPGSFAIFVMSTNIFDGTVESVQKMVTVHEPISLDDQIEIRCPHVIEPGNYFYCDIDIPRGTGLTGKVTMTDDISGLEDTTGEFLIPDPWISVPGYPVSVSNSNMTTELLPDSVFVLLNTHFKNVANISYIEFVPTKSGTIKIYTVKPVCDTGRVFCPLTSQCETACTSHLEQKSFPRAEHACEASSSFCSLEETCGADFECPASQNSGSTGTDPVSFEVVGDVIEVVIDAADVETIVRHKIMKELYTAADAPEPLLEGMKKMDQEPFGRDIMLAVDTNGVDLQLTTQGEYLLGATFDGTSFTPTGNNNGSVALRAVLYEDRVMQVDKKFFCETATEKTVTLTVSDQFGNNITVETEQVSCQYRIMTFEDLSPDQVDNVNENAWTVTKPFPENPELNQTKEYEVGLWARVDEVLTFHIRMNAGSHVVFDWEIISPATVLDSCVTDVLPAGVSWPDSGPGDISITAAAGTTCIFPFRYKSILYYGCGQFDVTGFCATSTDSDFNAITLGWCNEFCLIQYPRLSDESNYVPQNKTFTETEGTFSVYTKEYMPAEETQLILKRQFTTPGLSYQVRLTATNLHDETDNSIMTWNVLCANPVKPAEWTLSYEPYIRTGQLFNISLTITPGVPLPTLPVVRLVSLSGTQTVGSEAIVDNATEIEFFINQGIEAEPPDCSLGGNTACKLYVTLSDVGVDPNVVSGSDGLISSSIGTSLTLTIPSFSEVGSHGFTVQLYNAISSINPVGTGDWVAASVPKWDLNWVEVYDTIEEPVQFDVMYSLSTENTGETYGCEYEDPTWFMPASGIPSIGVNIIAGSVRRIQYTFNNTDPNGYQPEPCFVDWPELAFGGKFEWVISHCPNMTENTYTMVASVWNPLDGWISSKATKVEVIEQVGPFYIDDFGVVTDVNKTKHFNIKYDSAGGKTCVVVDWGDGNPFEFWGNVATCRLRYPGVTSAQVTLLDLQKKNFDWEHTYTASGNYEVVVMGFDYVNYAETALDILISNVPCTVPLAWIADNTTSWARIEEVPKIAKSKGFQKQAYSDVKCNETFPTSMMWRAYEVTILDDPNTASGQVEVLDEIQINETLPSYISGLLVVPPRFFEYGLHKLVFRFQVDTPDPESSLFREAHTYFQVVESPLEAILMEGSVAKVSRGWTQTLELPAELLSSDPDNPEDRNFNYTWFCRRVVPSPEEYPEIDDDDYPIFNNFTAQKIPKPGSAQIINPPPGCFGAGPGALKTRSGTLKFNTAAFITHSRVYEILLVLEKGSRRAKAYIEVEMLPVPAPVVSIDCASLCFPTFGGVFVNPTSRLALRGNCEAECDGSETYQWDIVDEFEPDLLTYFCTSDVAETTVITSTTTTPTTTTTTTTQPFVVSEFKSMMFKSPDRTVVISGENADDSATVVSKVVDTVTTRRRRKRQAISTEKAKSGCAYVFGDGTRDARDSQELAIQKEFFTLQEVPLKKFTLKLNVSTTVYNGYENTTAYGTSYLNVIINSPPENGTCTVSSKYINPETGNVEWNTAQTGKALLDEFRIRCENWVDRDSHAIVKYIFKITEVLQNGDEGETSILYSGPTQETSAVFPVGEYHLWAEIHEEAEAFTVATIEPKFSGTLPDKDEYNSVNLESAIASNAANQAKVSQILIADASIRKVACWFNVTCMLNEEAAKSNLPLDTTNMTDAQQEQFNSLMKNITNANTAAIMTAKDSLQFETMDQLAQGANTLNGITGNVASSGPYSKTLDMEGRQAAVDMISDMAAGFKDITTREPEKLQQFVNDVSGSVMSITENLNSILYANDPSQIPLTDFENARNMPYDTDIPEDNADIPDDPDEALRYNALKHIQIQAEQQVKEMLGLIEDIAKSTITNMVENEEMRTTSAEGMQMIMTKLPGSTTVGRDINGDGTPDQPLRYELSNSQTAVQFPLGFCPSSPHTGFINKKCNGRWGLVIKEWETITAAYSPSVQNLNPTTKTVDVDFYSDTGETMPLNNLAQMIQINIERMKKKDPTKVVFEQHHKAVVNVAERIRALSKRNKLPLIYHYTNITKPFATFSIQLKADFSTTNSRLVILVRHKKLPTVKSCDFLKIVSQVDNVDEGFRDWFIKREMIANREGAWYLGVMAVKEGINITETLKDMTQCENNKITSDIMDTNFGTETYILQAYSGGCYFFNKTTEQWEASGVTAYNSTKLVTGCGTSHCTSFASGFFPETNTIDFEFVFAAASFEDNLTIYIFIIITFIFYLCGLIYGFIKDRKDEKALLVPFLEDNHPDDKYMYEIVVETGPLASHATTSNISFILYGDEEDSGARCFSDKSRQIFKSGGIDAFLMTTPVPLGELEYIRLWTDSTGLGEMGAWYLLSVTIMDVQTGQTYRFIADQWLAVDRGTYEDDINVYGVTADTPEDTSYLLKAGGMRKLADDHIWWSVFSRPIRSRFSRVQRVTVCAAMLYLSFLTNAMYYQTATERIPDPFFMLADKLLFDLQDMGVGLISNFIVFPPVILCVILFKKSKPLKKRKNRLDKGVEKAKEEDKFNKPNKFHQREKTEFDERHNRSWPAICRFLAWFISLLCIFGGAFFIFAFAITFGNDKTYQWMVSMISAFFFSILVTQPLKIAILTCIIGICVKKPNFDDDHVDADEVLPTIYYDPEAVKKREKRPKLERRRMDPEFYRKLKERKNTEYAMKSVITDLVIYFIYVAIIFIISYGNRDPQAFLSKTSMESAVVFGGLNCDILPTDDPRYRKCKADQLATPWINFDNVRDVNEWWKWVNDTLIPNVRVQPWYNGQSPYGLRGYLDDRVNRLIGYAIIRQVREEIGTCRTAKIIRDTVEECTGDGGMDTEDTRDWCMGWRPKTYENCTLAEEFEYQSSSKLESAVYGAGVRSYGGGGYVLRLTGYIGDLLDRIELLKEQKWADNRTRALLVEFSTYNAQVNMFTIVTIAAEFVGGGVRSYHTINPVRLLASGIWYVTMAEILFVVALLYYTINLIGLLKKEGCRGFCKNGWNVADVVTVLISYAALALYIAKYFYVREVVKEISNTKGNEYIRLTRPALLNQYYEYMLAMTVFTSTIKFCKLLNFQKAFMQIGATINLCFKGLSTFVIEFSIVFCAFSSFFYFVLRNDLYNFRDFVRTLENTMAMSIGKFNFNELRSADELAAWTFFFFSIVVNMILINMMMAIINLAFEEIKTNKEQYKNKFELLDYIKRSAKEMIGITVAEPIVPKWADENDEKDGAEQDDRDPTTKTSMEFKTKTDELLRFIEEHYLSGFGSDDNSRLLGKLKSSSKDPAEEKKVMEYGFDAIFAADNKKSD